MVKSKTEIRLATRKDRLGIKAVNEASLPIGYDEKNWEIMIAEKCSFVAVQSGLVIGYIVCNKTGCVVTFSVLEQYRSQGIGKQLMQKCMNHMRQLNYKLLVLRVQKSNIRAQKFYQSMGFVQKEILNNYYGEGEDAYLLETCLAQ